MRAHHKAADWPGGREAWDSGAQRQAALLQHKRLPSHSPPDTPLDNHEIGHNMLTTDQRTEAEGGSGGCREK
ncbi:unnamed protein product [Gadus morhua 'NCC']